VRLYQRDDHRIVGHTGGQMSFVTFIFLDPDADVGLIGAYNAAGGDTATPDTGKIADMTRVRALDDLFPLFWKSTTAER
jgi:hypothetical protein